MLYFEQNIILVMINIIMCPSLNKFMDPSLCMIRLSAWQEDRMMMIGTLYFLFFFIKS